MAVVAGGSKANLVTGHSVGDHVDINFGNKCFLAQTFPLATDTAVWRCRFKQWTIDPTRFCVYGLRATDGTGKPFGPDLATTTLSPLGWPEYRPGKWRRFDFGAGVVVPAGTYALITSVPTSPDTVRYKTRADQTAPTYPGGKAYISNDWGVTWAEIPNTDFVFEIWGWEPPPEPPPEPCISNWAPTEITIVPAATTVTLVVTTDIPVHLWMRWTTTEPLKHPSELFRRGILLMSGTKWCFVSFHENEQEEPGDTYIHTFIKPNWAICETRWFYFLGTKQAEESPSASPIFHYHNQAVPVTIYPPTWHNRHITSSHGTWSTARNGYNHALTCAYQRPTNHLVVYTSLVTLYTIGRAWLNFNTQGMAPVVSARVGLFVTESFGLVGSLCLTKGLALEPIDENDWPVQTDEVTILGYIAQNDLVLNQYNWIPLNSDGIAWLNSSLLELKQGESSDCERTFGFGVFGPVRFSQSRFPQIIAPITSLKLRLRRLGFPGMFYVDVYEADINHKPVGPILASGSLNGNTLTTVRWGLWYGIDLGAGFTPLPGREYCTVGYAPSGTTTKYVNWIGALAGCYVNGFLCYSTNGGATWTRYDSQSLSNIDYETAVVGGTNFCLRTSWDVQDIPPISPSSQGVRFHSAQAGVGYSPLLEVTS